MDFSVSHIYALIDPRTEAIRYIGRTNDVRQRLWRHMTPKEIERNMPTGEWLRELRALHLKPRITVLETIPAEQWSEAERRQIALHRAAGCNLTNLTDGGRGLKGLRNSEETLRKKSLAMKGRPPSPQCIAASVRAHKGKPLTDDVKAKQSAALKGRKVDPAVVASRAEKRRGKTLSEEALASLTEARNRPERILLSREQMTGERNPMAKLDWGKAGEIRCLHADGLEQKDIAARMGVSVSTVKSILRGERWSRNEM